MKILYVAKHNSGDNDDEGAIAHALRELGHEVQTIQELRKKRENKVDFSKATHDFCLFHKWETVSEIALLNIPSCFWYFDLVCSLNVDTTLYSRLEKRQWWMDDVLKLPNVKLGFCTDGDWVDVDWTGKLKWLMQGADSRTLGIGNKTLSIPEILFTGTRFHGMRRRKHIEHLESVWKDKFICVGEGGSKYRKHGRELADLFASTSIVIAPDGPCTNRYWSNRVFLTCGLGGFLLHPSCGDLIKFYPNGTLQRYLDWEHLDNLINLYLTNKNQISEMREAGLAQTIKSNLYIHRCEQLVQEMRKVC